MPPSEGLQEADPLNALLTENFSAETDDERLYTDEFIRANENASRSLFLGFLGIAFLGTSVFAWFILAQPNADEIELEQPVSVPSLPSAPEPNINGGQPIVPPPQVSTPVPESEQFQSPLVFPVTPVTPDAVTPSSQNPSADSVPPPPPAATTP